MKGTARDRARFLGTADCGYGPHPPRFQAAIVIIAMGMAAFQTALVAGPGLWPFWFGGISAARGEGETKKR